MQENVMARKISKRRAEMGEEAWLIYQRKRKYNKAMKYTKTNAEAVVDWRRRTKLKLIAYKGGKCELCGYSKECANCYDFHHLDPTQKDFGIGGKSYAYERLQIEADKCQLLCKNCHAWIHEQEFEMQRKSTIEKLKGFQFIIL